MLNVVNTCVCFAFSTEESYPTSVEVNGVAIEAELIDTAGHVSVFLKNVVFLFHRPKNFGCVEHRYLTEVIRTSTRIL